jgi:hypothetical protein
MASRSGGMFLKPEERSRLIAELKKKGEIIPPCVMTTASRRSSNSNSSSTSSSDNKKKKSVQKSSSDPAENFGTGCLTCGEDDDHANLLLCEGCDEEYHTYCLDPPLRAVPTGDWFCGKCKDFAESFEGDDGLDKLVCALPPSFTSRFGEVCWAQGGVGFGWWPSFIYDPRLTVGNARQLARKNLGKRHLIYFFECHEAPFAVLATAKTISWEDGLVDDYHLGKTARAAGRARTTLFLSALQAATVETAKPIEMRLDWNHTEHYPQILPSPKPAVPKKRSRTGSKKRRRETAADEDGDTARKSSRRGFAFLSEAPGAGPFRRQSSTRKNLMQAMDALATATTATEIESSEDGELYCKLIKKLPVSESATGELVVDIGFVKLDSRKLSTFANARKVIQDELVPDCISPEAVWKFYVPTLGPVSTKQEESVGPIFSFLRETSSDARLGNGSLRHPLKVIIIDSPLAPSVDSSVNTDLASAQEAPVTAEKAA